MDPRQVDNQAAEARAIVDAIGWLRKHPAQLVEARTNLPAVLGRLGLEGTARNAVGASLALVLSAGVSVMPGTPWFWSS